MVQEREKGELLYRFVMNLFRITETKHWTKFYRKILLETISCVLWTIT